MFFPEAAVYMPSMTSVRFYEINLYNQDSRSNHEFSSSEPTGDR